MRKYNIKKVGVIGSGIMGSRIACYLSDVGLSVSLFDIYEGDNLPDNKKSYSVAFTFGDPNKTLTDQRVNKIIDELIATFKKEIGAEIR